jgi:hypothetical protein
LGINYEQKFTINLLDTPDRSSYTPSEKKRCLINEMNVPAASGGASKTPRNEASSGDIIRRDSRVHDLGDNEITTRKS